MAQLFAALDAGDADAVAAVARARPEVLHEQLDGVTPIRGAAYRGRADLVDLLRSLGAVPDAFDAAAIGDVDRLRSLLDDDPDAATATSGDGFTALHLAAWFGQVAAAELLLAKGADPVAVATNGTGLQPLNSAAAGGTEVIAHLLLDRGADIEAAQHGGVRPLHSAAHRDDLAMVRLLLERGADPSATTDDGRSPADLATDPAVLALLP